MDELCEVSLSRGAVGRLRTEFILWGQIRIAFGKNGFRNSIRFCWNR